MDFNLYGGFNLNALLIERKTKYKQNQIEVVYLINMEIINHYNIQYHYHCFKDIVRITILAWDVCLRTKTLFCGELLRAQSVVGGGVGGQALDR